MTPLGRATHHFRAAASLGARRPAYAAGLRAAVATMAPVLAAPWLPTEAATWMMLAGFNGALNDRGGSYRTRAMTMGEIAIATAIPVGLGALAHGHLVAAILLTSPLAATCPMLISTMGKEGHALYLHGTSGLKTGVRFPARSYV